MEQAHREQGMLVTREKAVLVAALLPGFEGDPHPGVGSRREVSDKGSR